MMDIGWRGVFVALVFIVDLIVFAGLLRAELRDLQARRAQRAMTSLGPHRTCTAAGSAGS